MIAVPMLKEDVLVGVISIYRQEVRPFTDKQVELVQNFAAQAVIAIENTRLLNELRESASAADCYRRCAQGHLRSPGELEPIFQIMLENATRICEAKFGSLILFEGNGYRRAALHNAPEAFVEEQARNPLLPLTASPTLSRVVGTKQVIHVTDILTEYPNEAIAKLGGARTVLCVPMLKDDRVVGAISIYRQAVRPFADKQIELVQNFADQAVIAIENTRLLNELRQETISASSGTPDRDLGGAQGHLSSPGDLKPVFEAMLENAIVSARPSSASVSLRRRSAFARSRPARRAAGIAQFSGAWTVLPARSRTWPRRRHDQAARPYCTISRGSGLSNAIRTARATRRACRRPHCRLPCRCSRKASRSARSLSIDQEVRPFTDKQIELVHELRRPGRHRHREHAAAQRAAPAHDDLRIAEQQTATREVLKVISQFAGRSGAGVRGDARERHAASARPSSA